MRPKTVAEAVRRSRSRSGPPCGARLPASAPVVAKTPAPSTGPGSMPPSTATATARGAGTVTAKRTTLRHGTRAFHAADRLPAATAYQPGRSPRPSTEQPPSGRRNREVPMTLRTPGRDGTAAVVVGASMAGLLTARVLSEHVDRVVVLDRDTLPEDAVPRGGVPQSAHAHGLLARGLRGLEELLPGLTADLVAQGALRADMQGDVRWINEGLPMARRRSGLDGLLLSRPLLEREVRRRVLADPRVSVCERVVARSLTDDGAGRVTGVLGVTRDDPASPHRRWDADLVVDASGRQSNAPWWLSALGF